MTRAEYQKLQDALDSHLKRIKTYYPYSNKELHAYERAIMAAKSVVKSNSTITETERNYTL